MFSNQLYNKSTLISVNELLCDKQNNVHAELYKQALQKFKNAMSLSETKYRFTEQCISTYYTEPSNVLVTYLEYPYNRCSYALNEYWPKYSFTVNKKPLDISNEYEITDIDYVSGKATICSKHTNDVSQLDFSQIADIDLNKTDDWYRYQAIMHSKQVSEK